MPFPNEHSIMIKTPNQYTEFKRKNNEFGNGIDTIYGVNENGKSEIQSIRFRKKNYSLDEVEKWIGEKWIEDNEKYKGVIEQASTNSSASMRFDNGEILGKMTKTPEGYLKGVAAVTRAGVFKYRNSDGTIRREFRDPKEVFRSDSLETIKMKPVVNGHPLTWDRFVDAKSIKNYIIGMSGETVRVDNDTVMVSLTITNEDDIKQIENGKRHISCGYEQSLQPEQGIYKGEPYDYVQKNIEYNHIAICNKGRAGEKIRLNIDAWDHEDSIMYDNIDVPENKDKNTNKPKGVSTMPTLRIKNIDYEAAQEVINSYHDMKVSLGNSETKFNELKKSSVELQARLDTAHEELKKVKDELPETIKKVVKERIALEKLASHHLDEDDTKEISSLDNATIKKKLIIKRFPNSKERIDSEEDEVYINARFDAAVELLNEELDKEKKESQIKKINNGRLDSKDYKPTTREEYINRLENEWNPDNK